MNKIDKLKTLQASDIGLFNLNNKTALGKVVQVYDANTCQVIFGLNNLIFKFNCKLANTALNNNSKNEHIINMVSNTMDIIDNTKIIKIICNTFDKEGYLLIELFDDKLSINNELINNNFLSHYSHDPESLFNFNSDK